jgi:predicted transposase/invertase (TIGR01784 family)
MSEEVYQPHDTGYKYLLSSKKAFLQLIKSFVIAGWTAQVDESSLFRVDKSFILQDFKHKESDLVYRARLKEQDVIFYILLEMQSTVDFVIPFRLLLYMTEVWRDIFKNIPWKEAERKDFRLPVIVPIVLYNSPGKWTVPLNFKETLNGFELFTEHVLDYKYILINVHAFKQKELLALANLIGSVFLLDQARDLAQIIKRLKKLALIIKKMEPEEFNLFASWVLNIISRGIPQEKKDQIAGIFKDARPEEVESMLSNVEKVLEKSWEEAEKKGVEKGLQQGLEQAKVKIAKQMLLDGEDVNKIAKYTGLTREEIDKLS